MRARAVLRAEADPHGRTRLATLRSQAPLILRPAGNGAYAAAEARAHPAAEARAHPATNGSQPAVGADVYLAAGAGGPVGGDELELIVEVGAGARLTLRSVGATVALPGAGESLMTLRLSVEVDGYLAVLPEPTVVASRARHRTQVEAEVAAGGVLIVREEVVLGRHGEVGGAYRGRLRVDVADTPLLRHELVLDGADPATAARASVTGGRACGSVLVVDPQWSDGSAADPNRAVLPLVGPGVLVTAVADDARTLRQRLDIGVSPHLDGLAQTAV